MTAQYAHLDGRRFVNADFVGKVRELFPVTTKKIPLGYSTYTGWTGKDEVLFTQHDPLENVPFEGMVYEVTFDPVNPAAFEVDILGKVKPTTIKKASYSRKRRSAPLQKQWGLTLKEAALVRKKSAAASKKAAADWIAWDD